MKITGLELFHISIPFRQPYKLSKVYGTLTEAHAVVLKVHTDAGIVGLGEADPMNPFTEEAPGVVMAVIRDVIAPHLLNRDPLRIAEIETDLDQTVHGNLMSRGAVNMALFDILGKVHQLPAHVFLGGIRHEQLPLLGPIGSGSPAEDADAIETLIQQGYRTVMIKMGALPVAEEIRRAVAAVERYGDRLTLIMDANQGWTFKETLTFVDGIDGSEPAVLEQPVATGDLAKLRNIRDRIPYLLSVDESLVTLEDAAGVIRAEAADAFSIKVSKNGGLSKSHTIARAAEVFGIKILLNSMLEFGITQAASLQVGCTLNNLLDCGHAYMSVLRMSDDITDFQKNISDAVVAVPREPGLGVSVDDGKLEAYTVDYLKIEQKTPVRSSAPKTRKTKSGSPASRRQRKRRA
jgi:L-alanine-DL-glutamate epimerase-like enolase superfamily enzyme